MIGFLRRQVANRLGVHIVRAGLSPAFDDRLRFERLLDLLTADIAARRGRPINFIQVGAHNGRSNDPLHNLILERGWRGVLVEPQPQMFRQLQQTYADQPQLILKNAAVDARPGERSLYSFRAGDPDIPDWLTQVASFDRRFLRKFRPCLPRHRRRRFEDCIVELRVECVTIDELAKELDAPLDLIQVDAEGYDWEIIRSIDLRRLDPAIIRYESRHLSGPDADACVQALADRGYRFIIDGFDTIAVKTDPN